MGLLKILKNISPFRGMPVDDKGASSSIITYTEPAAVQLYYWNSGVRTIDAGQAAGTVVEAQLTYDNIKNAAGSMEATSLDTSLAFTSSDLTTEVAFPWEQAEQADNATGAGRATEITRGFSNGEYCVDYSTGTVYGIKASTGTTLTAVSYKIKQNQSGSGTGAGGTSIISSTTGGTDSLLDSDGDNTAQACKTSGGSLYGIHIINPNTADAYLQVFDVVTGSVTVGTTTPKNTFLIPAQGAYAFHRTQPINFDTAITYACTTTATGSGDPATGLTVNMFYK